MLIERKEQAGRAGQQSLMSAQCLLRSCDIILFCSGCTPLPCLAPAQPGHTLAEGGVEQTVACLLGAAAFIWSWACRLCDAAVVGLQVSFLRRILESLARLPMAWAQLSGSAIIRQVARLEKHRSHTGAPTVPTPWTLAALCADTWKHWPSQAMPATALACVLWCISMARQACNGWHHAIAPSHGLPQHHIHLQPPAISWRDKRLSCWEASWPQLVSHTHAATISCAACVVRQAVMPWPAPCSMGLCTAQAYALHPAATHECVTPQRRS